MSAIEIWFPVLSYFIRMLTLYNLIHELGSGSPWANYVLDSNKFKALGMARRNPRSFTQLSN